MKKNYFGLLIQNLFWIVPVAITLILWEYTAPILFLMVFAFLGMIILGPVVNWVESLLLNRMISTLVTFTTLIMVLGYGIASFWPLIAEQSNAMQTQLTIDSFNKLVDMLQSLGREILPASMHHFIEDAFRSLDAQMDRSWQLSVDNFQSSLNKAGEVVMAVGSIMLSTIFVIVFTIILLMDGNKFKKAFVRIIPNAYFEMSLNILDQIFSQISAYIRGQFLAAFSVGVLTTIGLYFLQWATGMEIPYTLIIGLIAGFSNLVPFIGPIVGMIPAIVIFLVTDQSFPVQITHILFIMLTFMSVQFLDNILVSPLIMSGSVGFHPLMVIILVMLGGSMAGPLGMLFAIPVAAIIRVVIRELIWGLKNYNFI